MAGKAVQEQKILQHRMGPHDGVVIDRVHGVMPRPFILNTNGLELRDAMRQNRPHMVFPERLVHFEIIIVNRRIMRPVTAAHIGATTIFPNMNP